MNPDHYDKLKKEGVDVWNVWRKDNPDVIPDLRGANLTKTDLVGANLTKAYLEGANFTGANLAGANLTGTNLTGANLEKAVLCNTISAKILRPTVSSDRLINFDLNMLISRFFPVSGKVFSNT